VFAFGANRTSDPRSVSLTNLVARIKNNDITEIRASESGGTATARSGEVVTFTTEAGKPVLKVLANLGVTPDQLSRITYTVIEPATVWFSVLLSIGPLVFFAVTMLFMWR